MIYIYSPENIWIMQYFLTDRQGLLLDGLDLKIPAG